MLNFLKEVRFYFPEKTIWLWTGYEISSLKKNSVEYEIIKQCDYVVDGRFKTDLAGKNLRFRGSSNQIIWRNENGNFIEANDIENNERFKK